MDGRNYDVALVKEGSAVSLPTDPEKSGYTFDGWYADESCTQEYDATTPIYQDTDLYAKFTVNTYTITYNTDGGTNPNTVTSFTAEDKIVLADAEKSGYLFKGWKYGDEYMTIIPKGTTENIVLTAVYQKEGFSISYENVNGAYHSNQKGYNVDDETFAISAAYKDGYTFDGWYLTEDFSGEKVTEIAKGTTGDLILYAKFTVNVYTITYNADGGTNPNTATSFTVEDKIVLADAEKSGYLFKGWKNGDEYMTAIPKGTTEDIVLTAVYQKGGYIISYENVNGAYHYNQKAYSSDDETFAISAAYKDGYAFDGWYLTEDFSGKKVTEITKGTMGNLTLYAKFDLLEYKITYQNTKGAANRNATYYATYSVESPVKSFYALEKPGYIFEGWFYGSTAITELTWGDGLGDVTLTAKWTLPKYNISYNLDGGTNINAATYDVEHGFSLIDAQKDYYDFGGWYTTKNFVESSKIDRIKTGTYGDIELWAKWTPTVYSIGYEGVEGVTFNGVKPTSYTVESDDVALPTPEKSYYDFIGWTGGDITVPNKNAVISSGSNGNVIYTANWTPTKYNISYNLNGGTNPGDAISEYTVESFGSDGYLTLPIPTKADLETPKGYVLQLDNNFLMDYTISEYTFEGWYAADDTERTHRYETIQITDGNLNLVAYWTAAEGELQSKTSPYYRDGNTILMGTYPQSQVTDDATLAGLATYEFDISSIPTSGDITRPDGWVDSGEKYWYKDVEYDGQKYRGVFIVYSRNGNYAQQNGGYIPFKPFGASTTKIYWFKYDPIRWNVFTEEDGEAFLVCGTLLESAVYGHDKWAYSPIRTYLNDTLYNSFFNETQKAIILTSNVLNDVDSMEGVLGYATEPTQDKLFFLSIVEARQYLKKYKMPEVGTAYCTATLNWGGVWTRSHCVYNNHSDIQIVSIKYGNTINYHPGQEYTEYGQIVPAMRIKLN
ncbi:MAG: InlB B-repeat-containing protein [Butyrivibrio sp.]